MPVSFSGEMYSEVKSSAPYSRRHDSVACNRLIAFCVFHLVALKYLSMHSLVSHMYSYSCIGTDGAFFAVVAGMVDHPETVARTLS